jgi:hypothetical protein
MLPAKGCTVARCEMPPDYLPEILGRRRSENQIKSKRQFDQSNRIACGSEYCGRQPYCRCEPCTNEPSQTAGGPGRSPHSEFGSSLSAPSSAPGAYFPGGSAGRPIATVWFLPSLRKISSRPFGPARLILLLLDRSSSQNEFPHPSSAAASTQGRQSYGVDRPGSFDDLHHARGRYRLRGPGASAE